MKRIIERIFIEPQKEISASITSMDIGRRTLRLLPSKTYTTPLDQEKSMGSLAKWVQARADSSQPSSRKYLTTPDSCRQKDRSLTWSRSPSSSQTQSGTTSSLENCLTSSDMTQSCECPVSRTTLIYCRRETRQ